MMVTAVFGGTFDPVHLGHLKLAHEIFLKLDASVVLVPCRIPPHRPQPVASAEQRLAMLQLALADEAHVIVDDCELHRDGPSFTVDTLRTYRARLGAQAPLVFVMGVDAFLTLPTWEQWQSLTDLAHLLVLGRPGYEFSLSGELKNWAAPRLTADIDDLSRSPRGLIHHTVLLEMPVSASQIRQRLADGLDVDDWLPGAVLRYIRDEQLYLPVKAG